MSKLSFEEKVKLVSEYFEEQMGNCDVAMLWADYCREKVDRERVVRPMDNIDDLFAGMSHTELLSILSDDFDIHDDWFFGDPYSLESCNDPFEIIDCDELAEFYLNGGKIVEGKDAADELASYLEEIEADEN